MGSKPLLVFFHHQRQKEMTRLQNDSQRKVKMKLRKLLFFILLSNVIYGQNLSYEEKNKRDALIEHHRDSLCELNATKYLNRKFGNEFVKKYLIYNSVHRTQSERVVFFSVIDSKCKDGKNIVPIFCNAFEVDTIKTTVVKKQIVRCKKNNPNCPFYFDMTTAYNIGVKAGLKLVDGKFYIHFEIFGTEPKWIIETTDYENANGKGSGQTLDIDIKTGKYEQGMWSSQS